MKAVTPCRQDGFVVERWNPWRALRSRDDVDVVVERLPDSVGGGFAYEEPGWTLIALDDRLTRPERRAVLGHEVVHLERGGGSRHPDPAVRRREEHIVDREVARRLVPMSELAQFCARLADMGHGVTARDVAEEFDTTVDVAQRALELLTDANREEQAG